MKKFIGSFKKARRARRRVRIRGTIAQLWVLIDFWEDEFRASNIPAVNEECYRGLIFSWRAKVNKLGVELEALVKQDAP